MDFPGGSVVKNPPANADIVSIPGLGRFHMSQSNGRPGATTTEAQGPRAHALATGDNPLSCASTRESPHTAMETQCGQNQLIN